jgi:Zn-dependent alcohol dehydrogenase
MTGSRSPGQGATETWTADQNTVQRVLDETGGFGADYTFEATGPVAVTRRAVESARMGWGLCTVAGMAGRGENLRRAAAADPRGILQLFHEKVRTATGPPRGRTQPQPGHRGWAGPGRGDRPNLWRGDE